MRDFGVIPLVVSILLLVILGTFFGSTIRDSVVALLSSVPVTAEYTGLSRSALIERLVRAESELSKIRYQAVVYESLAQDLAALRKEVGVQSPEAYRVARAVLRPPRTHYDTLVLAAGSADGVRVGDIVSANGVALGTVTQVSVGSATADLYSTPGRVGDALFGSLSAIVTVRGLGGGALEATVPLEVEVRVGEVVKDALSGLPFAVVSSVERRDIDTASVVRLALPVSVASLEMVSLIHAIQ